MTEPTRSPFLASVRWGQVLYGAFLGVFLYDTATSWPLEAPALILRALVVLLATGIFGVVLQNQYKHGLVPDYSLKCRFCHGPVNRYSEFCEHCGADLIADEKLVTCPKCGAETYEGVKHCPECGKRLPRAGKAHATPPDDEPEA